MACISSAQAYHQGRATPNPARLAADAPMTRGDIAEAVETLPPPPFEDLGEIHSTACTDYKGTRPYRTDTRDPFWPFFAHPRWLSCDMLYRSCR